MVPKCPFINTLMVGILNIQALLYKANLYFAFACMHTLHVIVSFLVMSPSPVSSSAGQVISTHVDTSVKCC